MSNRTKGQSDGAGEATERDWLETQLQQWGDEAGSLAAPPDLGQVLRSGLNASASASARPGRSVRKRRFGYAAAVALLLAGVLLTASVSPAFASALQHIPGMSRILDLIGRDPGLQGAIEHDYYQPVGLSDNHDGNEFTVDGIVVDQVRMNVFFSVRLAKPKTEAYFGTLDIRDGVTGERVKALYSSSMQPDKDGVYRGVIDIQMSDGEPLPDTLNVAFSPDSNDREWSVHFPIDKTKAAGQEEMIEVDKEVTVGGQKLTITRARIYPTRLIVDISFDAANTKQIFQLGELSIVNEKGEVLQNKGAFLGEKTQTLQFDSSYFDIPKQLTLRVGRIMALDKTKTTMKIDLRTKKIVQAPDNQVSLTGVDRQPDGSYDVRMRIQGPTVKTDNYGYTIGNQIVDAGGKAYNADRTEAEFGGDSNVHLHIPADRELQNPISLKIDNYPAWIEEPFEVTLK